MIDGASSGQSGQSEQEIQMNPCWLPGEPKAELNKGTRYLINIRLKLLKKQNEFPGLGLGLK